MQLFAKDRLLFIGDSITDAGRDGYHRLPLGSGYPQIIASYLMSQYPDHQFEIINRGISGDRLQDLAKRWQADCLDLEPDAVSLLIGINDIWQLQNIPKQTLKDQLMAHFEVTYRELLESLLARQVRLLVMEPFLLPYPADRLHWRPDLDQMKALVQKLAEDYGATFIDLDRIFNQAGEAHGYAYYTGNDGVHPTVAGHGLIVDHWLQAVDVQPIT